MFSYSEMEVIKRNVGLWHCITHYPEFLANIRFSCNTDFFSTEGRKPSPKKPYYFMTLLTCSFWVLKLSFLFCSLNFFFQRYFLNFSCSQTFSVLTEYSKRIVPRLFWLISLDSFLEFQPS